MFPRPSILITMLAASTLGSGAGPAYFTLQSTGALSLRTTGSDARYGIVGEETLDGPRVSVSLGARNARGSLLLSLPGDRLPPEGRYPVAAGAEDPDRFHASFVAGSPERAEGCFEGVSGWVTITDVGEGEVAGVFEIRARGFLAGNIDDENQWVTVHGTFRARSVGAPSVLTSLH
jgi:hypothetical protein